jgi:hypothetical protein
MHEACPEIFVRSKGSFAYYYRILPNTERNIPCLNGNICDDLNAMHEAEKMLSGEQQDEYRDILLALCVCQWREKETLTPWAVFATAQQRAEAFLKVITKHPENKKEQG